MHFHSVSTLVIKVCTGVWAAPKVGQPAILGATLYQLLLQQTRVSFSHVKAHTGHPRDELAGSVPSDPPRPAGSLRSRSHKGCLPKPSVGFG